MVNASDQPIGKPSIAMPATFVNEYFDWTDLALFVTGSYFSLVSEKPSDGGRLLLTNQRLIFYAHALNINPNLYWELSLGRVDRTELGLNLLITQRVHIFDREENNTTFVVYGGKHWLNEMGHALNKIK
ncbi:hypothetical protein [Lysinibacillus sphaericus]|uniref:GRAM domain-containing protein n=1 Tax=Lysinibacillus sphaericus OT4b.31 TaxID=1285586 RepID=R7Z9G7_LYSSH|nr:hypothetical protein [Lysinibacillus sphaericus]EON70787.1 hypothetical protein H131_19462 [Lysinibacillus sphaericus OT4b.31]